MGLTRRQYVGSIQHQVAWLRWPDRLRVLWALLTMHATDGEGRRVYRA